MADASTSLKGLREQMVAAAQAIAEERRSHSGNSPIPSPGNVKGGTKPVIDGSALRTDDRQRLARERREEREKQNAAKESQMIEKEKKAKLQYERQMEERQRKMEEQKLKEEQRRAAVEEKRKLKTEEEKERNEAVLRRTLERSQRLELRQKRWSWGGAVPSDSDSQTGAKRSTSSCSLKQAETVLSKRLSSSSATLPNSADKSIKTRSSSLSRLSNKTVPHSQQSPTSTNGSQAEIKGGADSKRSSSLNRLTDPAQTPPQLEKVKNEDKSGARRSQTSPLESNILSRLLAPTQASLARSKNAAALSAEGKDHPALANTMNTPVHTSKGPMRSRSIDRQSSAPSITPASAETCSPESTQKPEMKPDIGRRSPSIPKKRPPSPSNIANRRRSPSPANLTNRPPSPSTLKSQTQKNRPSSPSLLKQRPSSAPSKPGPIPRHSLTSSVSSITKKKSDAENKPKDKNEEPITSELLSPTSEKEISIGASKAKEDLSSKITSGTITAEEAAKTLAEKRRLAREQRERDEQEKIQQSEEEERIKKEECDRKAAEENVRIEEARQKLEEKRQAEEEEALKLAEEEKIRKDLEELKRAAEFLQQKEEADAKALEEAEKQKLEREKIMQQNMQERLERKKRIEEIMKRTRKNDQSDGRTEEKSDDQEADELEDEEEFLQREYANQQGERNSIDLSQEIARINESNSAKSSLLASTEPAFQDIAEPEHIFVNGDEQSCDKEDKESFFENVKAKDSSVVSKENVQNSEVLQGNKDETIDSLQNINGRSNSWTFEEYIDLGINSNSTKLASDSRTASNCNQNMIDGAFIPTTPKVAFEEVGAVDMLTKSIEAASEI